MTKKYPRPTHPGMWWTRSGDVSWIVNIKELDEFSIIVQYEDYATWDEFMWGDFDEWGPEVKRPEGWEE